MAKENIEFLVDGTWRKDLSDLHIGVGLAVDDLGRLAKVANGFKINFSTNAEFKKSLNEALGVQKELQASTKTLEAQVRQLEKAKQEAAKTQEAQNKADKAYTTTLREQTKLINEQAKEKARLEAAMRKEEAAIARGKSAYSQLSKQYNDVEKAARDYGAEIEILKAKQSGPAAPGYTANMERLEKQFKETSTEAMRLHKQLLTIDESVGKSQRNVGNYKSQWNGVNNSISQLVREVPSVSGNLAMLPLALSNNIGPLIDSLKQAKLANAALAAEGKATIPVWKQVGSAIFSWQTALMAGIALLVAYSSGMFDAKEKTGSFADALKSAGNEYAEAKFKLTAWKEELEASGTTVERKKAIMEEYNSTLGDQMGKVEDLASLETKIINLGPKYIEMMLLRAKATAAVAAATELLTENMKDQVNGGKDLVPWWAKAGAFVSPNSATGSLATAAAGFDALGKSTKETEDKTASLLKMYQKFSAEAAVIADANGFDLDGKRNPKAKKDPKGRDPKDLTNLTIEAQKRAADALAEIQASMLEAEANRLKQAADDEKLTLENRLTAYEQYYNRKEGLIDIDLKNELEEAKLNNEKILHDIDSSNALAEDKLKAKTEVNKSYTAIVEAIYSTHAQALKDLDTQALDDKKKILETSTKEQLRVIMQGAQDIENATHDIVNKELITLNKEYEAKHINERDYQKERKRIIAEGEDQIFMQQREYFTQQIDTLERQGKLTKDVADKIRKELAGDRPANVGGKSGRQNGLLFNLIKQTFGELSDEDINQVVQSYVSAFDSINNSVQTIIANRYNAQIQGIESEMDLTKKMYEAEIAFINSKAITQQQREEQLADLKAKNTLKEMDQQRRLNAVKRRQAAAEKTANIAETIGKTAIAVMNALSVKPFYLGLALAAAAGITGAAQVAAISSTPLPQYAKGRGFGKDEIAIVNEKGPEAIVDRSGNMRVANSGEMGITRIRANEQVITAEKSKELLRAGVLGKSTIARQEKHIQDTFTAQVMDRVGKGIIKAVKEQKININVQGYDKDYYTRITKH